MMGEPFFDCQIGFVGCRAICLKGIMGVKDFEENMNRSETVSQNLSFSRPFFFFSPRELNVGVMKCLLKCLTIPKNLLDCMYLWLERRTLLLSL